MAGQRPDAGGVDSAALERLLEVTRQMARPFDLAEVLEQIVEAGRAILDADRGSVFLYESETDELVTAVATGVGTLRFPADKGIVGEAAQTRAVVNVPDCYADPRFNREADKASGYRTRCLLTVPLIGYDDSLVGVLQLLNKREGVFGEHDERLAQALAAQCAVAIQRVLMTEQLLVKERLESELHVARQIQVGFLPKTLPEVPGYDLGALSEPAEETGGDTFDLVPYDDGRLGLLLGDATGHGTGPALSVTQVRSMLRLGRRLGAKLDTMAYNVNEQLCDDLPDDRFVTAFLGVLDPQEHTVRYHSPGQAPLLHFHAATGEVETLGATSVPLGMFNGLVGNKSAQLVLEPGDILALMTDGVFEYEAPDGEMYGQENVDAFLREHHDGPMADVARQLLEAVRAYGATVPQADDITIVLVRRLPA